MSDENEQPKEIKPIIGFDPGKGSDMTAWRRQAEKIIQEQLTVPDWMLQERAQSTRSLHEQMCEFNRRAAEEHRASSQKSYKSQGYRFWNTFVGIDWGEWAGDQQGSQLDKNILALIGRQLGIDDLTLKRRLINDFPDRGSFTCPKCKQIVEVELGMSHMQMLKYQTDWKSHPKTRKHEPTKNTPFAMRLAVLAAEHLQKCGEPKAQPEPQEREDYGDIIDVEIVEQIVLLDGDK